MKLSHDKIIIDLMSMRHPYTGLSVYCQDLIDSLKNKGAFEALEITLFSPKNVAASLSELYSVYKINKLHKFFIPNKSKYKLWHTTYQLSKYFPFSFRGKILLTVHDLNYLHEDLPIEQKQKFHLEMQKRLQQASKIVAISEFVKSDIIYNYPIDPSKIEVIYRSIPQVRPIIIEPKFIPQNHFFFSVGLIEDKKNFKVLPAMLLGNSYDLILAGRITDVNYANEIKEYAKRLGVEKRLHIIGTIGDGERNWYLKNCQIMPFPSKAEGFGLPVLEAMQFGTPVLLSKFTSLPEIGGNTAFYFDSYDSESVQRKTNEVLNNISFNYSLSDDLRTRAHYFYSLDSASQYLNLYKEMLEINK